MSPWGITPWDFLLPFLWVSAKAKVKRKRPRPKGWAEIARDLTTDFRRTIRFRGSAVTKWSTDCQVRHCDRWSLGKTYLAIISCMSNSSHLQYLDQRSINDDQLMVNGSLGGTHTINTLCMLDARSLTLFNVVSSPSLVSWSDGTSWVCRDRWSYIFYYYTSSSSLGLGTAWKVIHFWYLLDSFGSSPLRPRRWLLRVFAHGQVRGCGKDVQDCETRHDKHHISSLISLFHVFFNEHVHFLLLQYL